MNYQPSPQRYANSDFYKHCGNSGLKLSRLSLGLWHNFGDNVPIENARKLIFKAFDLGITHFDLANNYGPPPGSAERNFGRILKEDLRGYRDELVIPSKAGYEMWDGPYGNWGSKKYMISSLNQSLERLGLEYVDIFYSHRPDPETPLEETMEALHHAVESGKALYVGLSNYPADRTKKAVEILESLGIKCLIHQPRYHMFDRWIENGLIDTLEEKKVGCIPFCPLAQGLLTNKYLNDIPNDSRAAKDSPFLNATDITPEKQQKLKQLDAIAKERGQTLAQLALLWVLRLPTITTALIGASKTSQIEDNIKALDYPTLSSEEIAKIDEILNS